MNITNNLEKMKDFYRKILQNIDNLTKGLAEEYNRLNKYVVCAPTPEMAKRGLTYDIEWMAKGEEQIQTNIKEIKKVINGEHIKLRQLGATIKKRSSILKKHGVTLCSLGLEGHSWKITKMFPLDEIRKDENGNRIIWKNRKCRECGTTQRLGRS